MKHIIDDVVKHGINTATLDAYLAKLDTALRSAITAAESGQESAAMANIGMACVHFDHVQAIWQKFNEQTPNLKAEA